MDKKLLDDKRRQIQEQINKAADKDVNVRDRVNAGLEANKLIKETGKLLEND